MSGRKRDCTCPHAKHEHGTRGAYTRDKCKCEPCTAANAAAQRDRTRLQAEMRWNGGSIWVSPVGTRRRLQALAAAGWTIGDLGRRLGCSQNAVSQLRMWDGRMLAATAAKVAAAYDELSHVVPQGRYATRARNAARRQGWAPPLAWDEDTLDDPSAKPQGVPRTRTGPAPVDEVAVAAALSGRRVRLNRAERAEAVRQATARGWSAATIADRLGTTPRTVQRRRAA